jgi:hypothetical protein
MLCGSGRVSVASCGMASPPHEHIYPVITSWCMPDETRGSNPARRDLFSIPHRRRAEIFALPEMSRSSSLPFYRLVRDRTQRGGLHLVRVFREDPAWIAGFRWFPGF